MKSGTSRQVSWKLCTFIVLCFALSGFSPKAGLDSYEIHLNNKLILQQYVNQPLNLRNLQLGAANDKDELRIHYKHCTNKGVGTGRSITVKDKDGNILKKWEFADSSSYQSGMAIPVKALRELEKQHPRSDLSLHYAAQEHPRGEMLASLQLK